MSDKPTQELISKTVNPLVFISHDTRDGALAEAFSNLLKSVSAGVLKSFRTSDRKGNQGIEYGVEWYPEIIKHIQGASDVVCLLTEFSVNRPWILFEAGMAKGKLDTPILGLALGIPLKDASSGPFAQFQNCGDDEDSLTKLVFQLVNRIPNSEPDEDTIKFQVGKFKETISKIFANQKNTIALTTDVEKKIQETDDSSAKLFEEIKIMFQDLPSRIEKRTSTDVRRRRRKFHPMMVDELMGLTEDPKLGFKIGLSFYKEKMPWIYDEGIALVNRLARTQLTPPSEKLFSSFEHLLMQSMSSSAAEMIFDHEEEYFFFKELTQVLLHKSRRILHRMIAN